MMTGFRRVQLRGSDELFRSTDPAARDDEAPVQSEIPVEAPAAPGAAPATVTRSAPPSVEGGLLRLSDDEIHLLTDAIQRVKFPGKATSRPSVDDFERLEELRQKLLAMLG